MALALQVEIKVIVTIKEIPEKYVKKSYPPWTSELRNFRVVVVIDIWAEILPSHNKNPSGFKVGKFFSVVIEPYML